MTGPRHPPALRPSTGPPHASELRPETGTHLLPAHRPSSGPRHLLPPAFRMPGMILLGSGAALLAARHGLGIAPEWLNLPAFAVSSLYLERHVLGLINNNLLDECAGVLLVVGSAFAVLSRHPLETPEVRLEAFVMASWAQAAAALFVVLFTYGLDFLRAVLLILPVFPLVWMVASAVLRRRDRPRAPRG